MRIVADDPLQQWPGKSFTRESIYTALHLKHTLATSDAALFSEKILSQVEEVKTWFDDPCHFNYKAKFGMMSISEFKDYCARALTRKSKESESTRRRHEDHHGDGRSKSSKSSETKRPRRETHSDDDDGRETKKSKGRRVHKRRRSPSLDSDALDR